MSFFRRLIASIFCSLALFGGTFLALANPTVVHAQVDPGLKVVGETTQLSGADPRVIAANIINVSLGLLGMIMLVLILYAGFLWMTAGGDAKQVEKAKLYIRNAIIGVILILSSWAIATFVINSLLDSTGGGGGGVSGTGPGGGGGGLGGGGGVSAFQVDSINPTGDVPIRNVQVRFLFTRDLNSTTASSSIQVLRASDASAVAGSLEVDGSLVTFTPSAPCPAPNADRQCFDANTEWIARTNGSLRSATGQTLSCGGFSPACEVRFTTGSLVDTADPTAEIVSPFDGQGLPEGDSVSIVTRVTDDGGVSLVETTVDGADVGRDGPVASSTPLTFDATVPWNTVGVAGGTHVLQSRAFDIDSNSVQTAGVNIVLRPRHCFNGAQDGDETAIDCGGASCGACSGGTCTSGTDCSSGVCAAGRCVEQPIIIDFSPADGRPGTFVTISGVNFGEEPGEVRLGGQVATAPAVCSGVDTWTSHQIVVAVPAGATTGFIQVRNRVGLIDTTSDTLQGPRLSDFIVNATAHPGLCSANPAHAEKGAPVSFVGAGLGSAASKILFDDREYTSFRSWSDTQVDMYAPNVSPATYGVKAQIGSVESNSVAFTLDEAVRVNPVLDSLDPLTGPVGEYITLQGRGFGDQVGTVKFRKVGTDQEGLADVSFPAACSANFWRNTNIVVKVPSQIQGVGLGGVEPVSPGAFEVYLVRQDGTPSNRVPFTVTLGTPRPGVCEIEPGAGPVSTQVTIVGERFGSSAGDVFFRSSDATGRVRATIDPTRWTSTEIITNVPAGSITGPVRVEVATQPSNSVNYTVRNCNEDPSICSVGAVCCRSGECSVGGRCSAAATEAQFAWRLSTGIIPLNPEVVEECRGAGGPLPSPSPWINRTGGDNACVNAEVVVRFNTHLDLTTIIPSNFIVRKCTADGAEPCATTVPVDGAAGSPQLLPADTESDFIRFRPNTPGGRWDATSTYEVVLTTGLRSDAGIAMLENTGRCGTGNAYCFRFTTRPNAENCRVGSVTVAPNPFTAENLREVVEESANPLSADDACVVLNGSSMNWSWYTGPRLAEPDGRASITNSVDPAPPSYVLDTQLATALAETGPDPVLMNAEAINPGVPNVRGASHFFVRLVPPNVEAFGPSCDQACVNAAIWARFNVGMDPARVLASNVILKRCTSETCAAFDQTFDLSTSPMRLTAAPGAPADAPLNYLVVEPTRLVGGVRTSFLDPERFYKVILRGGTSGFRSESLLALTELNDPEGFAWTFRIKNQENARCAAVRVDVLPEEKFETLVGERQSFVGQPLGSPDACNANGQPLINDREYAWSSSDGAVARFVNGSGFGLINTSPNLPAHCSIRCVNTGADGTLGAVPSCGNNVIETTDGNDCRRPDRSPCRVGNTDCHTSFGDVCRMLGAGAHGSEECDLGDTGNGRAGSTCSSACLWTGETGPRCGNGALESGEQCDSRIRVCTAGSSLGTVCSLDADCGAGGTCGLQARRGCSATCQALGSREAGATCGNNDIADGETCDDGNNLGGDGCSADCLHEGSARVTAVCGNTVREPGETCEKTGAVWPVIGCDARTCLLTGTEACNPPPNSLPGTPPPPTPIACCGNGLVEAGEESACESSSWTGVVAEGCSSRCVKEGSSPRYAAPSICGDGILGTGEQCEAAPGGDEFVDSEQVAEIVATRALRPDEEESKRMSSNIIATYDTKIGQAVYGLQCGFAHENDCNLGGRTGYGLSASGCCSLRPRLVGQFPPATPPGNTDVCRNTQIYVTFDMPMDVASLQANFLVAERTAGATCPASTQEINSVPFVASGWRGWVASAWNRLTAFFRPPSAQADVWCVGGARGRISVEPYGEGSRATFTLESALRASTDYQVVLRGDPNLSDTNRQGIRSAGGIVMDGNVAWIFKTGTRICAANQVQIEDTHPDHPYLFTTHVDGAPETHLFRGTIQSLQDGRPTPIVPVREYSWRWDSWVSSRPTILGLAPADDADPANSKVIEQNRNGSSLVFARMQIDRDDVNLPSTSGTIIEASRNSTVLLCERPWPSLSLSPFSDAARSDSLATLAPLFAPGPFYNFSTLYCMDAGNASSTADDLPSLRVNAVPSSASDNLRGILRQYLFTFDGTGINANLRKDGIGIRIIANPLHLSPSAWYAAQGFTGAPAPITVDGYEAIKDGPTVYVGATNMNDSAAGSVTSTIYLISYNPDASPETVRIYDSLLENWTFNVNVQTDSDNTCVTPGRARYRTAAGALVNCTADWECAKYRTDLRCASYKSKLQRDVKRISDFQTMSNTLEQSRTRDGNYPTIQTGSFLQTISTSRWPSWQAGLGTALQSTAVPQDPVNRFVSCGRCKQGTTLLDQVCTDSSECSNGATCVAEVGADPALNGFDPMTCWNEVSRRYMCPRVPGSTSHVYQYRSIDSGSRYEISTELEGPSFDRYDPPLLNEFFRCSNTGQSCRGTDHPEDCNVVGADGRTVSSRGTCNATGGRWVYQGMCTGREFGVDDVCGNGVRGRDELCEVGETATASCTTSAGAEGTRVQNCSDCRSFVDGPTTICVANSSCGNGVVDRYKCYQAPGTTAGFKYGQTCSGVGRNTECADPRDLAGTTMLCESVTSHGGTEESCDDGALNGTYGRCRRDCGGVGAYCGDGRLSLGEVCDNGTVSVDLAHPANGQYCDTLSGCRTAESCGLDCRTRAGYCGDRVTQPSEQCDGGVEQTTSAICRAGTNIGQPCSTNAECGTAGICGGPGLDSCVGVNVLQCPGGIACTVVGAACAGGGRCVAYPTQRTRVCFAPGVSNQCRWNNWTGCLTTSRCGDGLVDTGEECDDANASDNDSCTTQCRRNVCGDAHMNIGVEECDLGATGNGRACTGAEYGLTCSSCSTTCRAVASSGGFCGDGTRNGPEQCDRSDIPPTTCRALGFDYANQILCQQYGHTLDDAGRLLCVAGPPNPAASGADWQKCQPCREGGVDGYKVWTGGTDYACVTAAVRTIPPGTGTTYQPCTGACHFHDASLAPVLIDSSLSASCQGPAPTPRIVCSPTCGYSGCGRCSDTPAPGDRATITATVFDAVYSLQPVPNARVTLFYQGIRVSETFTNASGAFTFTNANRRAECGGYRVVIDSYVNNPNTPYDEALNGGYWPYESQTFNASSNEQFWNLGLENSAGKVFLAPRVGPGETLVITDWNGELPRVSDSHRRYIDAHLILPNEMSYPATPDRDVMYDLRQGDPNIEGVNPHANLFCFHSDDPTNIGCGSFIDAPEAMKFKRGSWGASGVYSFMLDDYFQNDNISNTHRYYREVALRVRVITQDRVYNIRPADTITSCGTGKDWLVFQQDALTGAVTIPGSSAGQFICPTENIPREFPAVRLEQVKINGL